MLVMISIYMLTDPLGFDTAYVGRSTMPKRRMQVHLTIRTDNRAMRSWLLALKARGRCPLMTIVAECDDSDALIAERDAIAMVRAVRGADCLNIAG